MIDIVHALITDGVKSVSAMKNTRNMLVIAPIFLFEAFNLLKAQVIPTIIKPTCVPDTAKI